MLSQLFILSPRGDTIVARDYRHDVARSSHEVFFRRLTLGAGEDGECAPVFLHDGVNYFHVKAGGLLICATSRDNLSPSLVLELLQRVGHVIKDYCGVLSEESLRKNFVLVYELLDEMIDYGYGQSTSTEALKAGIYNDPVTPPQPLSNILRPGTFGGEARAPPAAVNRSVLERSLERGGGVGGSGGSHRSEVFVDVLERLTVTFNGAGYLLTSEVDGAIQCKSFLVGNPQIRVALNEDLQVGSAAVSAAAYEERGAQACVLDDCTFHDSVAPDGFELDRTLLLTPPAGEFTLMHYRSSAPFRPPFRVTPSLAEPGPYKLDVTVQLAADYPAGNAASGVTLRVPLPKCTSHVSLTCGSPGSGQAAEFDEVKKELTWTFKRLPGQTEHVLRCRCTLTQERCSSAKREVGPVSLAFTLPNYSVSRLNIRFLQVLARQRPGADPPARWVRYLTQSSSYVCRL